MPQLKNLWGCSPMAETEDLKSFQCGFESHHPYQILKKRRDLFGSLLFKFYEQFVL